MQRLVCYYISWYIHGLHSNNVDSSKENKTIKIGTRIYGFITHSDIFKCFISVHFVTDNEIRYLRKFHYYVKLMKKWFLYMNTYWKVCPCSLGQGCFFP